MQSLYFVFKEHRINIIWHRRHVIIWKLGGGSRSKTLPIAWEEERHFWSKQQGNRNSKLHRRKQLKIKKIIENTSKRFKRKEVFLYRNYLFCRSSYMNCFWKENIVNYKTGLLKNKNKDKRVTKFSNMENEF